MRNRRDWNRPYRLGPTFLSRLGGGAGLPYNPWTVLCGLLNLAGPVLTTTDGVAYRRARVLLALLIALVFALAAALLAARLPFGELLALVT